MSLEQEFKNCNLKDMQLLYSTTKTVVLDNSVDYKKENKQNVTINQVKTFKGANEYDNNFIN